MSSAEQISTYFSSQFTKFQGITLLDCLERDIPVFYVEWFNFQDMPLFIK